MYQSDLPKEMGGSILEWVLVQTPALVICIFWIWLRERAYSRLVEYNKQLVQDNIEVLSKVSNAVENIQEELKKSAEKNEEFRELLLQLSTILKTVK